MKNSLLVFGTKNFNNSLNEIKEHLDFSLIFFKGDTLFPNITTTVSALLVDEDVCSDPTNVMHINKVNNKPILLITNYKKKKRCNYTDKIFFPLILPEFNSKVINLITSKKFNQNSSIKIKEYIIDKNLKQIKMKNLFVSITEKEIQLIELLFCAKKPITKNTLLKNVWKYSENADTHTIETHIYRLRKKILAKFNDEKFIINSKAGYSI